MAATLVIPDSWVFGFHILSSRDVNSDSFSRISGYCFEYRIFKTDIEFGYNIINIRRISDIQSNNPDQWRNWKEILREAETEQISIIFVGTKI